MDITLLSFVVLCLLTTALTAEEKPVHRVDVQVYYESLCPDSIKFITTQLQPALFKDDIAEHVNLTLIPYGLTTFVNNEYKCHHGPKECEGNKLHACALHIIQNGRNTDKLDFNKAAVEFISCTMKEIKVNGENKEFNSTASTCAAKQTTGTVNFADINNCAGSPQGTDYLAQNRNLTESLQKPLLSVPTVVLNKHYDADENKLAQTDFVKALCKYIDHDKPAACSSASATSAVIGIITLSLFLLCKIF